MDSLADSMSQVATPEIVMLHEHVIPYTDKFATLNPHARVSPLIETNNPHTLETNVPVAHKHPLIHETNLG